MIFRPNYIEKIAPFIDKPLVKILTGIRRCGKSTIFEMRGGKRLSITYWKVEGLTFM